MLVFGIGEIALHNITKIQLIFLPIAGAFIQYFKEQNHNQLKMFD